MTTEDRRIISGLIKDLKGGLSCTICYGFLINPMMITDCGHTFCSLCIKGIIGARKSEGRCPVCMKGSFSRRRGTMTDMKLDSFLGCLKRLESSFSSSVEPLKDLSKTDGCLLQGHKLSLKKAVGERKQRGRPAFSLESCPDDSNRMAELFDSPQAGPSVSLLKSSPEKSTVRWSQGTISELSEGENIEDTQSGLKENIASITLYAPQSTGRNPRGGTSVSLFYDSKASKPIRESKVCLFYQLSSMLPPHPRNSPKYPFITDILRRKRKRSISSTPKGGTPFPSIENNETPQTASRKKSSSSGFKKTRIRRLVNRSTPGKTLSARQEFDKEYGPSRRLSKAKILAAEPMSIIKSRSKSSPIAQKPHEERKKSEDLIGPEAGNSKGLIGSEEAIDQIAKSFEEETISKSPSQEIESTQDVIRKVEKLKELAAQLHPEAETNIIPPSDEDDEIYPSTPEHISKKRKRPSLRWSAKKKAKPEDYVFHPGCKIMSSALYTESDNSVYGEFRNIYEKKASFLSGSFDPSLSILVVGTLSEDDNRCNRTVKYLYALACGKLIVSLNWIRDSLRRESLLDPVGYIVRDTSGSNGPRISYSRTENTPPFFEEFEFSLLGGFGQDFGVEAISKLIHYGGGTLVKSYRSMNKGIKTRLIIVDKDIDGEEHNRIRTEDANAIFEETGIVTLDKDWVVESMGKYSIDTIDSYLVNDNLFSNGRATREYAKFLEVEDF